MAVSLLSACAGGNTVPATQEASNYQHSARRSYSAPGPANDPWGPYIHEASSRYDVPERWVREVMRVESGGRTEMGGRPITSGAGAMGLMQVMPATYDELRGRYPTLGDDPYDPRNSILAGTAYIRELYDLYGSPGFLAAYNGGPGRLDDYLTRNRPLPDETRRYVAKIGPYITDTFPSKRSTAEMYAMNSLPSSIPAGPRYTAPVVTAAAVPPPVSAPVEVAYAPAAGDDAFDPPPGWTPRAMSRGDAAAYVPPPVALPPVRRAQAPVMVADLPPARPMLAAPVALPEPPPFMPPRRDGGGFRLVNPALAAPVPIYRGLGASSGQWAIQVGAFGNEGLARLAANSAHEQAGPAVAGSHQMVAGVREPHGTLYRARLTGLSRDAATQACERLRNGRSSCIVLSPDAQS